MNLKSRPPVCTSAPHTKLRHALFPSVTLVFDAQVVFVSIHIVQSYLWPVQFFAPRSTQHRSRHGYYSKCKILYAGYHAVMRESSQAGSRTRLPPGSLCCAFSAHDLPLTLKRLRPSESPRLRSTNVHLPSLVLVYLDERSPQRRQALVQVTRFKARILRKMLNRKPAAQKQLLLVVHQFATSRGVFCKLNRLGRTQVAGQPD